MRQEANVGFCCRYRGRSGHRGAVAKSTRLTHLRHRRLKYVVMHKVASRYNTWSAISG